MNTERYRVSLRIQSECGKMRTRITPNTDTFHAVKLINNELKCTEIFNNFFNCTIKELKIPFDPSLLEDVSMIKDAILAAVRKCKKHPSIPKIKEMIRKMTFL